MKTLHKTITSIVTAAVILGAAIAPAASASPQPAVAPLPSFHGLGSLQLSGAGPSPFLLSGDAPQIGKYTCRGEVSLVPGAEPGTLEGRGAVAVLAANGDLIAGLATWHVDADGSGTIAYSWHDSVQFSNGTVVASTGLFTRSRPAGITCLFKSAEHGKFPKQPVVIAIIAILIAL